MINLNTLHQHIQQTTALPAYELLAVILRSYAQEDSHQPIDELVERIKQDPSTTANVLRVANSAFYHQAEQISTVENAIKIIGIRQLKSLLLKTCVNNIFDTQSCPAFSIEQYWQDALERGWCCEQLALASPVQTSLTPGELNIVGLLSNLGLLALVHYYPKPMNTVLSTHQSNEISTKTLVLNQFGVDQVYVGAELLKTWRLPDSYIDILRHISLDTETPSIHNELAILKAVGLFSALTADHDAQITRLCGITPDALNAMKHRFITDTRWIKAFARQFS